MRPGERLRTARARVNEVCGLLARPSRFNLELCAPLLESVQELLAAPGRADGGPREETALLAGELARADALARQITSFYGECVRLGAAGAFAYTARGRPAADEVQARPLGEA